MLASLEPLLFFVVFIAFFGFIMWMAVLHARKVREAWGTFARATGMHFTDGGMWSRSSISGQHYGLPVHVFTESRGGGKNKTTYTMFCVHCGLPPDLNLYKEGPLHFLVKALGVQDVQIGDPDLDRMFIIQSRDPAGARRLLTQPRIRAALLEVGSRADGLRLTNGQAVVEVRGHMTDVGAMNQCFLNATQVAMACAELRTRAAPLPAHPMPTPMPQRSPLGPIELMGALAAAANEAAAQNRRGVRPQRAAPSVPKTAPAAKAVPTPVRAPDPGIAAIAPAPPQVAPAKAAPDLADALRRLGSPGVTSDEREWLVKALKGTRVAFDAVVERVDWTSDISLPDSYRSGRTAICKFAGANVAVRFASARNAEIDALVRGASLAVRGDVVGWDDFFNQLTINA